MRLRPGEFSFFNGSILIVSNLSRGRGETPMVVAVEEYWNYFDEVRSNRLEIIRLLINAGAVQTEEEWEETLKMCWDKYLWENEGGGEYLAFSNAIHNEQFLATPEMPPF